LKIKIRLLTFALGDFISFKDLESYDKNKKQGYYKTKSLKSQKIKRIKDHSNKENYWFHGLMLD
jgi:hypothetical protein